MERTTVARLLKGLYSVVIPLSTLHVEYRDVVLWPPGATLSPPIALSLPQALASAVLVTGISTYAVLSLTEAFKVKPEDKGIKKILKYILSPGHYLLSNIEFV